MSLPIAAVLPEIRAALEAGPSLVLQAPPGAGKTTGVPPALLDAGWMRGGKLVMLEPRRLAARAAAARMAEMLGEEVGQTVGYRIRLDSKVGPATRIEVVTEGILTRMIQDDPELTGVKGVIFDEFHERSLHADLGLALCLEARCALRAELRVVVMSATLDGGPVARLLGEAPLITSEGRAFPVETRYLPRPEPRRFAEGVADAIEIALAEVAAGDLLVFLPGQGEIRRVEALLGQRPGLLVAPLYGEMTREAQDAALRTARNLRKVVLATAIAETSLTIEGVRVVIDSGVMRVPRFDPGTGMTRLATLPVSRASADQRRGRAGRLGPGFCYRLWPEAEERGLAPFTAPEILAADLAPLALDLAQWGVRDANDLAWLDPPPAAALAASRELLAEMGAVDETGAITRHGGAMNRLSMHPRLAHMVLKAGELGLRGLACDLAALLSERDVLKAERGCRDADIRLRIDALRGGDRLDPRHGLVVDRGALARVRASAKDWRRRLGLKAGAEEGNTAASGLLLAFAYPDRIARRRGGDRRYALSQGGGALFAEAEPLSAEDWLVAAETDGDRREARIFVAAPLTRAEIEGHFAADIRAVDVVEWSPRDEAVLARRQTRLWRLALDDKPLANADPQAVIAAMVAGIRAMGPTCLIWPDGLENLRRRVAFLARVEPEGGWPDLSDAALMAGLEDWLAPHLAGVTRRAHLERLDLAAALGGRLDWERKRRLDELAPTHLSVPSGSRVPLDYTAEVPVLAVRLQEMFGCAETPRVAGGRVPVLLHLLSPARRPVQVTADLASFWAGAYKAVKSDLKGQYPKHWWPDDPMRAEPTARAKPRR